MNILVVDDDPAMRLVLSMALEHAGGFEVLVAEGGTEAIECVNRSKPDSILLDLVMPDVDGSDVLQELRTRFPTVNIPVIFLTLKKIRTRSKACWHSEQRHNR